MKFLAERKTIRVFNADFSFLYAEIILLVIAAGVNLVSAFGTSIVMQPDSAGYLSAAHSILTEGNFSEVTLNRTPGYSLFLVPFLWLFGENTLFALKLTQHALAIFMPLIIFKIGKQLDSTGWLGLLAGLFSCFCFQFQSYAHLPMSEFPYGMLCALGLLFSIKYLKSNKGNYFFIAIVIFAVGAMIRPQGKFLAIAICGLAFLRFLFPRWHYLTPAAFSAKRKIDALRCILGILILCAVMLPWMLYNHSHYGSFKLTGTFGLNIYSNTVESAGLVAEESQAQLDIREKWALGEAMRIEQGLEPETKYTWRNHWPASKRYRLVTGQNLAEADDIFLEAGMDGIKKHLKKYLKHVWVSFFKLMTYYEPTYLYVPGIEKKEKWPNLYKFMWNIYDARNSHFLTRQWVFKDKLHYIDKETFFTPIYAGMIRLYHPMIAYQKNAQRLFMLFLTGVGLLLFKAFRKDGLPSAFFLFFIFYQLFVPMFVVQWSPRQRLATDPIITLCYATVVLAFICLSKRIVERIKVSSKSHEGVSV